MKQHRHCGHVHCTCSRHGEGEGEEDGETVMRVCLIKLAMLGPGPGHNAAAIYHGRPGPGQVIRR